MKCPNCNSIDSLIKLPTFYICSECVTPKFDIKEIEDRLVISDNSYDESFDGPRIIFNHHKIKGIFKIIKISNKPDLKISPIINDYSLSGCDNKSAGGLRAYTGIAEHYFHYYDGKSMSPVVLNKEDFEIHI